MTAWCGALRRALKQLLCRQHRYVFRWFRVGRRWQVYSVCKLCEGNRIDYNLPESFYDLQPLPPEDDAQTKHHK